VLAFAAAAAAAGAAWFGFFAARLPVGVPDLGHLGGLGPLRYVVVYSAAMALVAWIGAYLWLWSRDRELGLEAWPVLFVTALAVSVGAAEFGHGPFHRQLVWDHVNRAVWNYAALSQTNDQSYGRELKALALDSKLTPAGLAGEPDLDRTAAKLRQARALVAAHRARDRADRAKARAILEKSFVGRGARREAYTEFDDRFARVGALMDQRWDIEESVFNETIAVVAILDHARGTWRVTQNRFLFNRASDMEKIDARQQNIRRLMAEGDDLDCSLNVAFGTRCHARVARGPRSGSGF
jgi:hypothetical protein